MVYKGDAMTNENNPKTIRVRWRGQEIMFVTGICFLSIAGYVWNAYTLTSQSMQDNYVIPYRNNHLSFNYNKNVLVPQIISVLLLYGWYIFINKAIVPFKQKISVQKSGLFLLKNTAWLLIQLIIISCLLALCINTTTYYAHPYFFNYSGFQLLALFGYNDNPLTNLFVGVDRALLLTGVYAVYVYMRGFIINYIQKPDNKNVYRVLVTNQVTGVMFIYLSVFWITQYYNLVHEANFFVTYFSLITPVLLISLSNIYWLFPLAEEKTPIFSQQFFLRLLASTFVYSLLFFFFPATTWHPLIFVLYWAAQLFIVTPVSWLIYQQRKDKILQLRRMEKALIRSKADIQFIRSQINPHFLFNTLNTLYGVALQDGSSRAAEGIQKLGDMMRFMLHENNIDFIPLRREIEYLGNYIALQKLRIQSSPNITIETNINDNGCNYNIAPMMLIPLVENAFKHGISLIETSWIKINLACDENNIRFEVRNSMHTKQDGDTEQASSGIGVNNIVERLKHIYPGKHQIFFNGDGKEFLAQLSIHL